MRRALKKAIKVGLDYFGYKLLSEYRYNSIYSILSESLEYNGKSSNIKNGSCCLIIFSKDRPLQLFALLESYSEKCKNHIPVKVLYKASDAEYELAYREVFALSAKLGISVEFIKETNFRLDLIKLLSNSEFENILFIVDDNIFIRDLDFDVFKLIDPTKSILSLRLGQTIEYSYTSQEKYSPPGFSKIEAKELLSFRWGDSPFEWNYPFSLDGHLFSFSEIKYVAYVCNYSGPNSFENALLNFSFIKYKRLGLCFPYSIILNLPINKTQNENNNISGDLSSEECLRIWNAGLKLNWGALTGYTPRSCHEEHYLPLVHR